MKYIISVGTNIGDRSKNITDAISAFNLVPDTTVLKQSGIYETEPVGYADQQSFYNAVFEVESKLDANEILGVCLGIEAGFGRVRQFKNGPRIIDLDLIFAEDKKIKTPNLTVPHPRYSERRFVLVPLLEIFPDGNAYGTDFAKYIDSIEGQAIRRL